ncbi:hypothetical protein A2U01_0107326, partial [Trifolium medium]|nr:hypothetical protein [Trifolium medium]
FYEEVRRPLDQSRPFASYGNEVEPFDGFRSPSLDLINDADGKRRVVW